MKNPLHIAFAAASFLVLGTACLPAQAQQAEYVQPAQYQLQNQMQSQAQGQMPYQGQPQFQQAYPVMDQNQYAAQQWAMQQAFIQKQGQYQPQQQPQPEEPKAAKPHVPSDYELQEQAIQKGLSENASTQKPQTFNEGTNTNWSTSAGNNESYPGSPSKLRGLAKGASRMLGRTAQVALPTVGAVLLTRALNKNSMGMNRGYGSGYGYNNGYGTGYGNGYGTGYGNMGYNGNMATNSLFGR